MTAETWTPTFVQGRCPACNTSSLFVAMGGYVTCGASECTGPTLVADLLEGGLSWETNGKWTAPDHRLVSRWMPRRPIPRRPQWSVLP